MAKHKRDKIVGIITPGRRCPECTKRINQTTGGCSRVPRHGDLTICVYCHTWLRIDDSKPKGIRLMDESEKEIIMLSDSRLAKKMEIVEKVTKKIEFSPLLVKPNHKVCPCCGDMLHYNQFSLRGNTSDAMSSWCKACNRDYQREWRKAKVKEAAKSQGLSWQVSATSDSIDEPTSPREQTGER